MLLSRQNIMLLLTLVGEDEVQRIARQSPLPQAARIELDENIRQEMLFLESA